MGVEKGRQQYWARLGANTRLAELRREIAEILTAYPELRSEFSSLARSNARRRRRISPEARAAMSEGMRKYWARRKAQKRQKTA